MLSTGAQGAGTPRDSAEGRGPRLSAPRSTTHAASSVTHGGKRDNEGHQIQLFQLRPRARSGREGAPTMGFCVGGNRDVGARGMGRLVAWPWVFQGVAWVQRSFHSEDGAGEKSTDLEVCRPLSVGGRYQCREPAPAAGTQSGPRHGGFSPAAGCRPAEGRARPPGQALVKTGRVPVAARGLGGMWGGGAPGLLPADRPKSPPRAPISGDPSRRQSGYPKTRQRVDSAAACSFCMEAGLYAAAAGSSAEPRDSEGSVLAFQLALARCTNNSAWPRG